MQKKFYLNKNTNRLHIVGGCCHSRNLPKDAKIFQTEDEAIKENTRYMVYCKLCFKNKD